MDNKCKKITCTSMERTNLRRFILVIKLIIKTISTVHFSNQNAHSISTGHANTSFPSLVPLNQLLSRACAKISPVSKLLISSEIFKSQPNFLCVTSIYAQSISSYLMQTNLNLISKHCNLHLNSVTFCGRVLFAIQTNQNHIKLCSAIQLLLTIVQLSPYLK